MGKIHVQNRNIVGDSVRKLAKFAKVFIICVHQTLKKLADF